MSADPAAGRVVIALAEVDSTNAEGFRRATDHKAPFWIIAGRQTAGRGRRGRPWASPQGNFHGTLVMQPTESAEVVALRSFVAALALCDALAEASGLPDSLQLKWPNDVLMNGAKIAGILLESTGVKAGVSTLCIGIGVNLIAAPESSQIEPEAVLPVSLLSETGKRVTPEAFLAAVDAAYAGWEAVFVSQGFGMVRAAWLARAARLGKVIRARTGTAVRDGVFETIDPAGNLVLHTKDGTVAIPAAEVFF